MASTTHSKKAVLPSSSSTCLVMSMMLAPSRGICGTLIIIRVIDIIEYTVKRKWKWAGHTARMKGNRLNQTLHRVVTKEMEEIKRTTKQKMARRHNREGGNHLDQEGNRQTTMEDTDGGLHPAVDGQSLDEDEDEE